MRNLLVIALAVFLVSGCSETGLASNRIVEIARAQLGKGEEGGNNAGKYVLQYTQGRTIPWCASFVSWILVQAGESEGYMFSARSFWSHYADRRVGIPREGDVVVFWRDSPQGTRGHVGIVEKVEGGSITTIEGNVGPFPARVKRCHYTLGKIKNLIGFVRVDKKG